MSRRMEDGATTTRRVVVSRRWRQYIQSVMTRKGPSRDSPSTMIPASELPMGSAADAPHGSRPEQVYARLRDLIVQGLLAPGSRIVETEIATRLGVSRTPVR